MPRFIVDQKLYGWDGPERQLKRTGNALALLAAGNLLLSVLLGVIPTGVTRHNWVSFAATLALLALLAELIAAVRFRMVRHALDKRSFDSIHQTLRWSAQCHLLLMAMALAAGVVSCAQAFSGAPDLVVVLGFCLSLAGSLLFLRIYSQLRTYDMKAPE